jgi:hypothetical protein
MKTLTRTSGPSLTAPTSMYCVSCSLIRAHVRGGKCYNRDRLVAGDEGKIERERKLELVCARN